MAVDQDRQAESDMRLRQQPPQRVVVGPVDALDPREPLLDRQRALVDVGGVADDARDGAEPAGDAKRTHIGVGRQPAVRTSSGRARRARGSRPDRRADRRRSSAARRARRRARTAGRPGDPRSGGSRCLSRQVAAKEIGRIIAPAMRGVEDEGDGLLVRQRGSRRRAASACPPRPAGLSLVPHHITFSRHSPHICRAGAPLSTGASGLRGVAGMPRLPDIY